MTIKRKGEAQTWDGVSRCLLCKNPVIPSGDFCGEACEREFNRRLDKETARRAQAERRRLAGM